MRVLGFVGVSAIVSVFAACGSSSSSTTASSSGSGVSTSTGSSSSSSNGSSSSSGGLGGSGTTSSSSTSSSSGVGGSASTSTSSSSSSTSGGGCALTASCTAVDKTCVGLVDNSGQTTFGLRMTELDVSSPSVLAGGLVGQVVGSSVGLDLAACNQAGNGTFSWLLQLDTTAMTLKTGGAKPVTDPTTGYAFENDMVGGVQIAPVTYANVSVTNGMFSTPTGLDVAMPVYLNANATSSVVLPLRQLRFTSATLSSNNDCIGAYNAAGLQSSNNCAPSSTSSPPVTGFLDAATLDSFITLADADAIVIAELSESLCAVLAGGQPPYTTTNSSGVTVCARYGADAGAAAGQIVYQGGWCSTTNMAATSTCADADEFKASFAAASIKIN